MSQYTSEKSIDVYQVAKLLLFTLRHNEVFRKLVPGAPRFSAQDVKGKTFSSKGKLQTALVGAFLRDQRAINWGWDNERQPCVRRELARAVAEVPGLRTELERKYCCNGWLAKVDKVGLASRHSDEEVWSAAEHAMGALVVFNREVQRDGIANTGLPTLAGNKVKTKEGIEAAIVEAWLENPLVVIEALSREPDERAGMFVRDLLEVREITNPLREVGIGFDLLQGIEKSDIRRVDLASASASYSWSLEFFTL